MESDVHHVKFTADTEPSAEMQTGAHHTLKLQPASDGRYVILEFSTRLAMYEFGKMLMREALYAESAMLEINPLDGLLVNSTRLTDDSSTLLVFYDKNSDVPS